jgi:hypothetical protein
MAQPKRFFTESDRPSCSNFQFEASDRLNITPNPQDWLELQLILEKED